MLKRLAAFATFVQIVDGGSTGTALTSPSPNAHEPSRLEVRSSLERFTSNSTKAAHRPLGKNRMGMLKATFNIADQRFFQ